MKETQESKTGPKNATNRIQIEFAETRRVIQAGFNQLHHDNVIAQQSLNKLLESVSGLHDVLKETNEKLVSIYQEVKDVNRNIQQGNKLLAVIHNDLGTIQGQLVQLNQDINRNSQAEQALLTNIASNLDAGFKKLDGSISKSTQAIVNSQDGIKKAIYIFFF